MQWAFPAVWPRGNASKNSGFWLRGNNKRLCKAWTQLFDKHTLLLYIKSLLAKFKNIKGWLRKQTNCNRSLRPIRSFWLWLQDLLAT